MHFNAYILDWTMNEYDLLKMELKAEGFEIQPQPNSSDIRVSIPLGRVAEASILIQKHLNAPQNYVDVQFPNEKQTILIFRERLFVITDEVENAQARVWALAQGLPPEQADWAESF